MGDATFEMGPIVLFVDDVARAKAFYASVLGFEPRFEDPTSVAMVLGTTMVLLVEVGSAAQMLDGSPVSTAKAGPSSMQLCLFVSDVDASRERMVAQGVTFIVDPVDQPWGRRTAHFTDPDGNLWEISQEIA